MQDRRYMGNNLGVKELSVDIGALIVWNDVQEWGLYVDFGSVSALEPVFYISEEFHFISLAVNSVN